MNKMIYFIFSIFLISSILNAEELTIVYTNSLNGQFDSCKCKKNPHGGLVKRATVLKELRKKYSQVILLESGDFFHYEKDMLLSRYLVRAYKKLNYDAITPGDQELSVGVENFIKYKRALPLICNNLVVKINGRFVRPFKRYKIIKRGNIKIGIIGSISPRAFRYSTKKIRSRIRVLNQVASIKKDVAALKRQGVHLIILLSHSGFARDKLLIRNISGLDVIVGGHSQTLLKRPYRYGKAVIIQAGVYGARIGILRLNINGRKIKLNGNSFRLPTYLYPSDDKEIRKLIEKYKQEIKSDTSVRFQ